jgi:predicted alpha/beta hydrolase family esterase
MVTHVIIVHGAFGAPEGNWFPWLRADLEKAGLTVAVPRFPTPEGQDYASWQACFDALAFPPASTFLIGHSIGAAFLLRMLEQASAPYAGLFLVAPFVERLGLPDFDAINASFVDHVFDWGLIRAQAHRRVCFAGDNDPYVPLALARRVAEGLNVPLQIVPGGGHLNADAGFLTFPALEAAVKESLV